jgi:hypothetical protein
MFNIYSTCLNRFATPTPPAQASVSNPDRQTSMIHPERPGIHFCKVDDYTANSGGIQAKKRANKRN